MDGCMDEAWPFPRQELSQTQFDIGYKAQTSSKPVSSECEAEAQEEEERLGCTQAHADDWLPDCGHHQYGRDTGSTLVVAMPASWLWDCWVAVCKRTRMVALCTCKEGHLFPFREWSDQMDLPVTDTDCQNSGTCLRQKTLNRNPAGLGAKTRPFLD